MISSQSPLTSSPYHFVPIPFHGEDEGEKVSTATSRRHAVISPRSTVATTPLHVSPASTSSSSSYMTPQKTIGNNCNIHDSGNTCSGFVARLSPPPVLQQLPNIVARQQQHDEESERSSIATSYQSVQKILLPTLEDDGRGGVKRRSINDLPSSNLLPRQRQNKKQRRQEGGDVTFSPSLPLF